MNVDAPSHGVQQLLRIGRNTADLQRAVAFYRDALGFSVDAAPAAPPAWTRLPDVDAAPARCTRLTLGAQQIELTEFPNAERYPLGGTACDLWFQHCAIAVSDMDAAYDRVTRHAVTPITRGGPQRLPPATGSVNAFKFRDPDGHPLELIHFPAGTGDPAWQAANADGATLGIDHSAISVADAEHSARFYTLLGMHVAARGVNHGAEQERLDALAAVEVDVLALQAPTRTPHLELLGYRHPRGRSAALPPPTAIAADRTVWHATAIDVLLDAIDAADHPGAVIASGCIDGVTTALLRDPDGHLIVLVD